MDYRTFPLAHTSLIIVLRTIYSSSFYPVHHEELQQKFTRHTRRQKVQFKEIEQASELDGAKMLELSDRDFKKTVFRGTTGSGTQH